MNTINVYSFNELSEAGKERAINEYRNNQVEIFWQNELLDSLKGLFSHCNGIKLKDYSLGEYNSWIEFEFSREECGELSGKRAFAWIENNLLQYLRISYTSQKRKEFRKYGRYYRAGMIAPCPFTGYCADDDFLNCLLDSIKDGKTLEDSFNSLACEYQRILKDEIEYQNSSEFIAEIISANDYKFLENGKQI